MPTKREARRLLSEAKRIAYINDAEVRPCPRLGCNAQPGVHCNNDSYNTPMKWPHRERQSPGWLDNNPYLSRRRT